MTGLAYGCDRFYNTKKKIEDFRKLEAELGILSRRDANKYLQ